MRDRLIALLGRESVLAADWQTDRTIAGVPPLAVVLPADAEQVSAVVRLAAETGTPVEPAGGGTWLNAGRTPAAAPILLSTARLQRIEEYEPADLTATLGAGVPVQTFQESAARHRQFIALDAPAYAAATMGALVSTGSAGPLRYAYGTPRDQVLGLELVTGDGRIMKLGGRVVKNVAGYDLTRLLVGSRGTLGVITAVSIRLRPLPSSDVTFALSGAVSRLIALAAALRTAPFEPVTLEIVPQAGPEGVLYVRVHGNAATVEAAARAIEQGAGAAPMIVGDEKLAWRHLNDVSAKAAVSVRLAVLPADLDLAYRVALRIAATLQEPLIAMHAGNGIIRIESAAANDATALAAVLRDARAQLDALRGTVIVPAAPPDVQQRVPLFPEAGAERRLMRELKQVFDPAGIMAPGRFSVDT